MARGASEKGRRIQRLPARSSALLIRFQAAWSSLSPDATSSGNASHSTSATVLTGWMWISQRPTYSGTSSRSGSFATGHNDVRETNAVGCKRLAAAIHPATCVASPSGRVQTTFSSHVRARSSGPATTWATSRSSDVLPVPAGAEIMMTPRATARSSASRSRLRSGSGALHLCHSPSPAQQRANGRRTTRSVPILS